jgi:hypothetical protein
VRQLFVDFQKVYGKMRKDILYNNLIEFSILTEIVKIIKMCLYEAYSKEY